MALVRTILGLVILLILVHVGLTYVGVEQDANQVTTAAFGLATLLESPAVLLLNALPAGSRGVLDPDAFYPVALTAAAGYFILYLLFGVGRNR